MIWKIDDKGTKKILHMQVFVPRFVKKQVVDFRNRVQIYDEHFAFSKLFCIFFAFFSNFTHFSYWSDTFCPSSMVILRRISKRKGNYYEN